MVAVADNIKIWPRDASAAGVEYYDHGGYA